MSTTIPNVQSFLNIIATQRDNLHPKQENNTPKINTNTTNSIDTLTLSPTLNTLQQFLSMNDTNNDNSQDELNMSSLEQLKQQGDILANMLQMKLKGFESDLLASMKKTGIEQVAPMDIKNDTDGLNIVNDVPNKQILQNLLQNTGKFKEQFQEIARLSTLINTVQQLGNNNNTLSEASAKYAQFSKQNTNNIDNPRRNESDFTLRVLESNMSSMF
ncbi:MAG: hypothetical protein LBJ00_18565 [Planctomycetaceae bacterium]|jgi:hypothetical protein|nr:hypothetical protein [Planctomycetaceae bacterium]